VRHDVAMTGEISLHGTVLPIGGLREKLIAALRAGIRTVVVPERNREDVERLPREVRRRLEIRMVEHVGEAISWGLCLRKPLAEEQAPPAPAKRESAPPHKRRRSA